MGNNDLTPGDWLKEQMDRKRLSNHDVARAVGLRDQAVYYWVTGRTAPKDEAAAKLAELLDVSEMEVRRRFGLWVPEETDPAGDRKAQLREELKRMEQELAEMQDRIRRLIEGG
jgi:plasmid maintenance system antidote protein VapI